MSLYEYLEISDINISQREIKKSYYRLAKIYHPDKSSNTCEQNIAKFKEVALAYEILSNPETRLEYDNSIKNDDSPYNLLIKVLNKSKFSKFFDDKLIDNLINKMYGDSGIFKENLKTNINNYEFQKLYNTFFKKSTTSPAFKTLDISYNINLTLDDIYENKLKKLNIKRFINNVEENHSIIIPLDPYTEELIFENQGDIDNRSKGNIIINMIMKDNSQFDILDNYNLLIKTKLFNSFKLPNSDIIIKDKDNIVFSCTEYEIYKYNCKGLLNKEDGQRGILYIKNFLS